MSWFGRKINAIFRCVFMTLWTVCRPWFTSNVFLQSHQFHVCYVYTGPISTFVLNCESFRNWTINQNPGYSMNRSYKFALKHQLHVSVTTIESWPGKLPTTIGEFLVITLKTFSGFNFTNTEASKRATDLIGPSTIIFTTFRTFHIFHNMERIFRMSRLINHI